ncbi:MAG: DUF4440 domain-containing protein [Chloroherpetonaceae bacterium]|nr:DUF4440 domain-containing protein [Chloroherpetonaceae bacterium]
MKRNSTLLVITLLFSLFFYTNPLLSQDSVEKQISRVLTQQQYSWNAGNIEAFMDGYKESDSLKFVSVKGVTSGFQSVLKRYLTSYSSTEKMGELAFDIIEIKILSPSYAFVIGKWQLTRSVAAGGNVGGHFTLLFEKTGLGWKIIVDHTS